MILNPGNQENLMKIMVQTNKVGRSRRDRR